MSESKRRLPWSWIGGGLALLTAGGVGVGLFVRRRRGASAAAGETTQGAGGRWARPGMGVTFRGELMPGRDREERTFRVAELLPSGRVTLEGVAGEHTENEFEQSR